MDYAFANMYLHHVELTPDEIKEMARICKPGGTLVITDLDAHSNEFLKREHKDSWMGFQRDAIRRWFEETGLREVTVECVGENCCSSSSCGSERTEISIFVASGKKPYSSMCLILSSIKGAVQGLLDTAVRPGGGSGNGAADEYLSVMVTPYSTKRLRSH